MSGLTSLDYGSVFYVEHKAAGLDYLAYGFWQGSYAQMVSEATLQTDFTEPRVFDAGCACGSILNGFRETGIFQHLYGMDLSEHMINLGRERFGFLQQEMYSGSIADIPLDDGSISLVHCSQVLEHVADELVPLVFSEFARILVPGGRAFLALDAVRHGETAEKYMGDPTHVNLRSVDYWTTRLHAAGFWIDMESYNRFVRSTCGPFEQSDSFYFEYPDWSVWTVIKR